MDPFGDIYITSGADHHSSLASDFFFSAGLGLGHASPTDSDDAASEGQKSMSCERTFAPTSSFSHLMDKIGRFQFLLLLLLLSVF